MRRAGFTLVETMVVGTIMLSMSLVATVWLTGMSDLWWTTMIQSELRTQSQQVMNRVLAELRSGTRTSPGSPPNAAIPAAPGNTTMTFYLPTDLDADGTIIDAIGNTEWDVANEIQYVYDAGARQLLRVQGGTTVVFAHDVDAVTFEDADIDPALNANEVKITLTLEKTTPQQRTVAATAVEIVKLRN
jgi:type II secretory pathway pseudopilin PulG